MALRAYLRLRARVLGRQLAELGWLRLLLLTPLVLGAIGKTLLTLAQEPAAHWLLPPMLGLVAWSGHRRRADLALLPLVAPQFRRWLAAEYLLLAGPVLAALLAFGHWPAALLTLAATPLVAWLPAARARSARLLRRRSWFRSAAFEWVGGFRLVPGGAVWVVLLALSSWQHRQPMVPVLAVGAWTLLVGTLFGTPEPPGMLLLTGRSPGQLLLRRLQWAGGYYLLTATPLVVIMAEGAAGRAGAALFWVWGCVLIGLLVLAKYAFYPQATLIRLTQGGVTALVLLAGTQTVYSALLLAAALGLVLKSRHQLASYRFD
ncbi:hypothetical protein [Hymenobacter sp. B81]|uniref:hypothetical protein n=1 Tax=Hymenobacter sp. B81 TaxID=3344878 RepID=UPI0037DD0E6B